MPDIEIKPKARPKAKAKPKAPTTKSVQIINGPMYDGDTKYVTGQTYNVRTQWADAVIKSDKDSGRKQRIEYS